MLTRVQETSYMLKRSYLESCYMQLQKKYLLSVFDDSVITFDEVIDAKETKSIPKSKIWDTKIFYLSYY